MSDVKKSSLSVLKENLYGFHLTFVSYESASHDFQGGFVHMNVTGTLLLVLQKGEKYMCVELRSETVNVESEVYSNLVVEMFVPKSYEDYVTRCRKSSLSIKHPESRKSLEPYGQIFQLHNEVDLPVALMIDCKNGVGLSFFVDHDDNQIRMNFKPSGSFYSAIVNFVD